MSLGLEATGHTGNIDIAGLKKLVKSIAGHTGLPLETVFADEGISVMLTDNGVISIDYLQDGDDLTIRLDSQTSILGPGFHKMVVGFIDSLADLAGAEFEVDDETGYYEQRDFDRLRKDHFEVWLEKVVTLLSEKDGEAKNFMVNWDMAWPRPESIPSTIVMPFGRFGLSSLAGVLEREGVAALADKFFPCPDEVIDPVRVAWYNALYLLWVKCCFMPSERSGEDAAVNSEIITLLEQVTDAGEGFAIPKKEYLELCRLAGRTPVDLAGIADYHCDYAIGFRKGNLTYDLGNVAFRLPGYLLRFDGEDGSGFWNGSDDDAVIRISAFNIVKSRQDLLQDNDGKVVSHGEIKNGEYVMTYMGLDDDSHITQINLVTENQFTLFTLASAVGVDKAVAIGQTEAFLSGISATKTDIVEKIQKLTADEREEEVVNMILALPAEEQTDEIKGFLARAYNNLGQYGKALPLLLETEATQKDTANWNFRIGYSYYFLDDFGKSLGYFRRVLEITPDDEDARWFITQCQLNNPFARRVDRFWKWFGDHSDEMEKLLKQKEPGLEKLRELIDSGLDIIGEDVYYNVGGDNELTFCVESHTECHYIYPCLVGAMPETLRGKWSVYPCKQPAATAGFSFGMYDKMLNIAEIKIAITYNKEANCFDLNYYHPILAELEEAESLNAFYIILELTIGEGAVYNYIDNVAMARNSEGMFPIGELKTAMKFMVEENGKSYSTNPELPFCLYKCEPKEDEERVRFDIISGTSQYMSLNREYLDGERGIYDRLVSKGVEPLMLIMTQPEGMSGREFLDFRYMVEDRLQELFDKSIVKGRIIGGAYGSMGTAYIDMLLYDSKQFIDYIGEDATLDQLLAIQSGVVCPTKLYFKGFTQASSIGRLR